MNNTKSLAQQKPRFSVAITTPAYQKLISDTIRDPQRASQFIAAITSAVAVNPALQECEASTVIAGALLGESLRLTPSPQLGQYYLVPFECKIKNAKGETLWLLDENGDHVKDSNGKWKAATEKKVQFVLGYKGYIQLAIRSGQYKRMVVKELKEGELVRYDPLDEEIQVVMIDDFDRREAAPTIGYYAMFEYLNGFRKSIYWSKEKMLSHAARYSSAFSRKAYEDIQAGKIPEREMWKYPSFWYKDFDGMACKTTLRQLISKWGVMSIEMQQAFEKDTTLADIDANGKIFVTDPDALPALSDTSDTHPVQDPEPSAQPEEPEQIDLNSL